MLKSVTADCGGLGDGISSLLSKLGGFGDGLSGVMAYGNGFMSMDSGEVYDSFVIDLLWKYEEYNGAVEQDFVDAIGAYGDFLDRICTEVQATYDLAEECYNMNPEERPWELTIGYNPSGSS